MRSLAIALTALALCSCDVRDWSNRRYQGEEGKGSRTGSEEVLFIAGVEYPDGYDWMRDSLYGNVGSTLFLSTQESRVKETTYAPDEAKGTGWNRHRIIGGKLWTDYAGDGFTRVLCDGREMFAWEGEENVDDIFSYGNSIYFLCESSGPRALVLRKDGVEIMRSSELYSMSSLYEDSGNICFSAMSSKTDPEGKVRKKWYLVEDCALRELVIPETGFEIDQAMKYKGGEYLIVHNYGDIWEYRENHLSLIDSGVYEKADITDILCDGDDIYIEGYRKQSGTYCCWKNGSALKGPSQPFRRLSSCIVDGSVWAIGENPLDGTLATLYNGKIDPLPEEYSFPFEVSPVYSGGHIYAALVKNGRSPSLWIDGAIRDYRINGYFDKLAAADMTVGTFVDTGHGPSITRARSLTGHH